MGSMSMKQFLFSFEGRTNRSAYWLKWTLPYMVVMVVLSMVGSMFAGPTGAISGLVGLAALWPSLAVAAKRWHDRDKSGWWTLILLVPVVGALWMLIECGFLKGTDGPNRFGDDPLQAGGYQPAMEPQM